MRRFVTSSLARRHILVLGAVLAAGPALAQAQPATGAPDKDAVGAPRVSRSISATGRTMPLPGNIGQPTAASEVEMGKAQKAAEARSKAWDAKMHKTMSSICNGC